MPLDAAMPTVSHRQTFIHRFSERKSHPAGSSRRFAGGTTAASTRLTTSSWMTGCARRPSTMIRAQGAK